jgi:hypothetical protein
MVQGLSGISHKPAAVYLWSVDGLVSGKYLTIFIDLIIHIQSDIEFQCSCVLNYPWMFKMYSSMNYLFPSGTIKRLQKSYQFLYFRQLCRTVQNTKNSVQNSLLSKHNIELVHNENSAAVCGDQSNHAN